MRKSGIGTGCHKFSGPPPFRERGEKARRRRHVIKRARERWGIHLTFDDVWLMSQIIKLGLGRAIGQRREKGQVYLVTTLERITIPVMFHHRDNTIKTVMPRDSREVRAAMRKGHNIGIPR